MSGRRQAIEAMWARSARTAPIDGTDLGLLLDAIPADVLANLAIERGALKPAVWEEPADSTPMGVCGPRYHPYPLDEELGDATELGYVLLYRVTEVQS